MLKHYTIGLLAALMLLCGAPEAEAADCGTRARPSQSKSCTCKPKLTKGKLRQVRTKSSRACWKRAVQVAKRRCRKGASGATFRWKKGRLAKRACTIAYVCGKTRRRKRGVKVLPKRYSRSGKKLVRFKYRIGRSRRPCVQAAKRLKKKVCGRNAKQKPGRFTWRKSGYRVKFIMGFKKGRCQITWRCWYKKKSLAYWCE